MYISPVCGIYCQGADPEGAWGMRAYRTFGRTYCHRGTVMLKTRIQLPVLQGGKPTDLSLSLAQLTEQYAEQTLLPAIREAYDSLGSVAEKMHFEPYRYCHTWHAQPHPAASGLLTVHIETALTRAGRTQPLLHSAYTVYLNEADGRLCRPPRRTRKKG